MSDSYNRKCILKAVQSSIFHKVSSACVGFAPIPHPGLYPWTTLGAQPPMVNDAGNYTCTDAVDQEDKQDLMYKVSGDNAIGKPPGGCLGAKPPEADNTFCENMLL